MGHVREVIHIDAPLDVVWALGADANRIPEWNVNATEVKGVSGPLDHVGAGYTTILKIVGRKLEGRFEVTKVDKPRFVEFKGTSPAGGRATAAIHLEPTSTGTQYTFEIDYELPGGILGGVVDRLFAERMTERDIHHSVETFKALCEAEAKVPA